MHKRSQDITGNRYGSLVVLYPITEQREDGSAVVWRCRCDCGKETNVVQSSLVAGIKKSCGCLKEKTRQNLSEQFEMVDGTCVEWLKDRKRRADNKTGCKGVFRKKNGKYAASIGFKKKVFYIGTYETLNQAVEARKEAEDKIFGSFLESYRNWKSMSLPENCKSILLLSMIIIRKELTETLIRWVSGSVVSSEVVNLTF